MKAVQINSYGGTEVLEVNNEAPRPVLSKGQVLVEVKAASINPFDVKISQGYLKDMAPLVFPATLGGDFSGAITELGDEVSDFKKGDEVFGQAILLNGGSGSFAEYLASNTGNIAQKPSKASFDEAAALALVGASSVQALEDHIKLQKRQKILIHGGAGGIGHIAIQVAKALGAYVATTVSTDDVEFAKKLGADEVIDYKTEDFTLKIKEYDAVFDTVANQESLDKSVSVLKKGGILVSMLGKPDEKLCLEQEITAISQMTNSNTEHLKKAAELVESGKVKVYIDSTFSLDQMKEAFEKQMAHPKGKVVIHIK